MLIYCSVFVLLLYDKVIANVCREEVTRPASIEANHLVINTSQYSTRGFDRCAFLFQVPKNHHMIQLNFSRLSGSVSPAGEQYPHSAGLTSSSPHRHPQEFTTLTPNTIGSAPPLTQPTPCLPRIDIVELTDEDIRDRNGREQTTSPHEIVSSICQTPQVFQSESQFVKLVFSWPAGDNQSGFTLTYKYEKNTDAFAYSSHLVETITIVVVMVITLAVIILVIRYGFMSSRSWSSSHQRGHGGVAGAAGCRDSSSSMLSVPHHSAPGDLTYSYNSRCSNEVFIPRDHNSGRHSTMSCPPPDLPPHIRVSADGEEGYVASQHLLSSYTSGDDVFSPPPNKTIYDGFDNQAPLRSYSCSSATCCVTTQSPNKELSDSRLRCHSVSTQSYSTYNRLASSGRTEVVLSSAVSSEKSHGSGV